VDAAGSRDAEALNGFSDDAFAFFDRQRLKGFVLKPLNLTAIVMVSDPTLEADIATTGAIFYGGAQLREIKRLIREFESAHD
jgi:hypothetical protein